VNGPYGDQSHAAFVVDGPIDLATVVGRAQTNAQGSLRPDLVDRGQGEVKPILAARNACRFLVREYGVKIAGVSSHGWLTG
jgi:hypothetical protein